MSRREPMKPVEGLRKPTLPPPTSRPRTLRSVPPTEDDAIVAQDEATSGATAVVSKPAKSSVVRSTESEARVGDPGSALMRALSVSVPVSLAEAWRDRAKRDRVSQVDVLLDAIVAHRDELGDLVASAGHRRSQSDGLFDRRPVGPGERSVGISLRIKASNLAVIDDLASEHGPVKRSPFVAAVLTAYLA